VSHHKDKADLTMNIRGQRGITLMGFLIVLAVAGFFMLIGAKLFPAYSEFNSLKKTMDAMSTETGAANFTIDQVWYSLERRFNISYVETPKRNCLKIERKNGNTVTCAYEYRTAFVYNIDFVVNFSHTVKLGGGAVP
jgi:Tfp pilus assembly protein PilE